MDHKTQSLKNNMGRRVTNWSGGYLGYSADLNLKSDTDNYSKIKQCMFYKNG